MPAGTPACCNGSEPGGDYADMKARAARPGQKNSVHLADLPMPSLEDIPEWSRRPRAPAAVVDGTGKEINAAEYGAAPAGYEFLTIGHENFGRVVTIGPNVNELRVLDAPEAAPVDERLAYGFGGKVLAPPSEDGALHFAAGPSTKSKDQSW